MNKFFLKNIVTLALSIFLLSGLSVSAQVSIKTDSDEINKKCVGVDKNDCILFYFKNTHEASIVRGSIAYTHYCVLCHGRKGMGDGRAARIHNPKPANLVASVYSPEDIAQIIRKGGEAMGRSMIMPPWGDQLTDEQIKDIVNYVMSIRKPL